MSIQFASDETDPWPSALCRQTDPELFFIEKGASSKPAKKICAACIYFQDANPCLEDALAEPIQFGVRGGFTAHERNKILRTRRLAAK